MQSLARIVLGVLVLGCSSADQRPNPPPPAGGAGGEAGGSGGAGGGGAGGSGGAGGGATSDGPSIIADAAADSRSPDAGMADSRSGGDAPPVGPIAPGQGPAAEGRIVFSQDFETGMTGIGRSPENLPADRAVIVDDPAGQRGKVIRVVWQAGDNFRTSGGTEPRSWISSRPANEFRPGQRMSHAFGFMTTATYMEFAFAQIISVDGVVWMLRGSGDGSLRILCGICGGNTGHMILEPNRWYDFRVDIDFRVGGQIQFYVNGQMISERTLTSTRGNIAHWDGGIYNTTTGTASNRTRTVYISNVSIAEK